MSDCPNCGKPVGENDLLCPNCGFDVRSQHAEHVRELREEGRIHPGRIGAKERGDFAGGDPSETPHPTTSLPAEDRSAEGPEEIDAGL
jgi:zinc-ribbon domain